MLKYKDNLELIFMFKISLLKTDMWYFHEFVLYKALLKAKNHLLFLHLQIAGGFEICKFNWSLRMREFKDLILDLGLVQIGQPCSGLGLLKINQQIL